MADGTNYIEGNEPPIQDIPGSTTDHTLSTRRHFLKSAVAGIGLALGLVAVSKVITASEEAQQEELSAAILKQATELYNNATPEQLATVYIPQYKDIKIRNLPFLRKLQTLILGYLPDGQPVKGVVEVPGGDAIDPEEHKNIVWLYGELTTRDDKKIRAFTSSENFTRQNPSK